MQNAAACGYLCLEMVDVMEQPDRDTGHRSELGNDFQPILAREMALDAHQGTELGLLAGLVVGDYARKLIFDFSCERQ